jgi:hypothetical protein
VVEVREGYSEAFGVPEKVAGGRRVFIQTDNVQFTGGIYRGGTLK